MKSHIDDRVLFDDYKSERYMQECNVSYRPEFSSVWIPESVSFQIAWRLLDECNRR